MIFGVLAGLTIVALLAVLVILILSLIFIAGVVYIAGRIVVGPKATFGNAIAIALLGVIIGGFVSIMLPAIGWVVALLLWIILIKSFYKCGWLAAIGIAILAAVIWIVMWIVLGLLAGIALFIF